MNLDNNKHGLNRDTKIFINENLCRPIKSLHYKGSTTRKNLCRPIKFLHLKVRQHVKIKKSHTLIYRKENCQSNTMVIKLSANNEVIYIQHINDRSN